MPDAQVVDKAMEIGKSIARLSQPVIEMAKKAVIVRVPLSSRPLCVLADVACVLLLSV